MSLAGVVGQRQLAPLTGIGAGKNLLDRRLVEALEGQHARARRKRGVQLEGWVLGGGSDQDDGAVLHMRQKCILLRPVESNQNKSKPNSRARATRP